VLREGEILSLKFPRLRLEKLSLLDARTFKSVRHRQEHPPHGKSRKA
jgi:hypothetical protein